MESVTGPANEGDKSDERTSVLPPEVIDLTSDSPVMAPLIPNDDTQVTIKQEEIEFMDLDQPMTDQENSSCNQDGTEQTQASFADMGSPPESQREQHEQLQKQEQHQPPASEPRIKQEDMPANALGTNQQETPPATQVTIDLTGFEDDDEYPQQSADHTEEAHNDEHSDHTDTKKPEQSTVASDVIMADALQNFPATPSTQDQTAGSLNGEPFIDLSGPKFEPPTLTTEVADPTPLIESEEDIEMSTVKDEQPQRKRASRNIGFLLDDSSSDGGSEDDSNDGSSTRDLEHDDVDPDDGGEAKFNKDWEAHQASVIEEHELQADYDAGYLDEAEVNDLNDLKQKNELEARRLCCADITDSEDTGDETSGPIQTIDDDSDNALFVTGHTPESREPEESEWQQASPEESEDEADLHMSRMTVDTDEEFPPLSELFNNPRATQEAAKASSSAAMPSVTATHSSYDLLTENRKRSLARLLQQRRDLEEKEVAAGLTSVETDELDKLEQKIKETRNLLANKTNPGTISDAPREQARKTRNVGPRSQTAKDWHAHNAEKRQSAIYKKRALLKRKPTATFHFLPKRPRLDADSDTEDSDSESEDKNQGNSALQSVVGKLRTGNILDARMELGDLPDFGKIEGRTLKEKMDNLEKRGHKEGNEAQVRKDKHILRQAAQSFGLNKCKLLEDGNYRLQGMNSTLFPHQVIGVSQMLSLEFSEDKGGINADEMGMGKTVQMLACIATNRPSPADRAAGRTVTLIVAPSSAISQWKSEIKKHVEKGYLEGGAIRYRTIKDEDGDEFEKFDIVLTSYQEVVASFLSPALYREYKAANCRPDRLRELEQKHMGLLFKIPFWRVVLDEAHSIKNHLSQTFTACCHLDTKHRWALTGTPLHNHLEEFRSYLEFLHLEWAPSPQEFRDLVTNLKHPENKKQIEEILETIMIRRTSKQTLLGHRHYSIPTVHQNVKRIPLTEEESIIYRCVEDRYRAIINWLIRRLRKEGKDPRAEDLKIYLAFFTRLRQATAHAFLLEPALKNTLFAEDLELIQVSLKSIGTKKTVIEQIEAWRQEQKKGQGQEGRPAPGEDPAPFGTSKFGSNFNMDEQLKNALASKDEDSCKICFRRAVKPQKAACGHTFCEDCVSSELFAASQDKKYVATCRKCGKVLKEIVAMEAANRSQESDDSEQRAFQAFKKKLQAAKTARENPTLGRDKKRLGNDYLDIQPQNKKSQRTFLATCDEKYPEPMVPSAKTTAVKETVLSWHEAAPDDKIIIFVQFVEEGQILGRMLQAEGFTFVYYFGEMGSKKKDAAIAAFCDDAKIKILVSSLKCGGVALNLTCANRVIVTDPWWNSALESQSVGRVYRIGQKKETYFEKILAVDTIDTRIEKLQKEKQKRIDQVLKYSKSLDFLEVASLLGNLSQDEEGIPFIERDYKDGVDSG